VGALQEIGDRVWVRRYRFADQTIGVIGGDDGLLVIDTRSSHRQAAELQEDVRELAAPVRWIVNSHMHSDHCFGNAPFEDAGVELWGHHRCASGLQATGEKQRAQLIEAAPDMAEELREVIITPPRHTFADAAMIDVGGRRVELRYLGRGHTDNDIVITVPDAAVLFAADLLENGAPPWFGDAFPLDWPATVERLLGIVTGPVVPGHGEVADRALAERQLGELREIADLGQRVADGDLGLEDAVARGPFGPEASREPIERAVAQARGQLD
jgi:glyoxylase-like metal-dependent hydrolase (beta-lactamase superfamily II)